VSSPAAIATSAHAGLKRNRGQVDLQPHAALVGDVSSIGPEAVADVDHRGRSAGGQGPALAEAGLGIELARSKSVGEVVRHTPARPALQKP